jgi:precorrin-3B methylase
MKKLSLFAFATLLSFGFAGAIAAEAGKETTLTGTAKCAKCALKQADKCQDVLVVKEGDKEVVYAIKGAGHKFCKGEKENVTVKGVVSEEGGQKVITASK